MDAGLNYPIPTFPQYLFSQLPESCQGRAQVSTKPDQLSHPRGDVRNKSRECWTWLIAVLQFWGDEASIANGIVYGYRERPVSTLAEYVLNTINPDFEPGCQITWDDVVIWTPWLSKRLHGMTAGQEKTVRHQALRAPGVSSELEVALEGRYSEHILNGSLGRGKAGEAQHPQPQTTLLTPRINQSQTRRCIEATLEEVNPGTGMDPCGAKRSGPRHRAAISNT